MDSFNDAPGRPGPLTSSTPHVVVECPSCKTKFAVESIAIASIEHPKFHCSRCDAVFSLDTAMDRKESAPRATGPHLAHVVVERAKDRVADAPRSEPTEEAHPKTVEQTPSTERIATSETIATAAKQETKVTETKAPDSRFLGGAGHHFPRSAGSPAAVRASDFSLGLEPSMQEASPSHSDGDRGAEDSEQPESSAPTSKSETTEQKVATERSSLATFPSLASVAPKAASVGKEVAGKANKTLDATPDAPSKPAPTPLEPIVRYVDKKPLFGAFGAQVQSLAIMTTPLAACMALLLLLSYSLRVSPHSLGGLVTSIVPSLVGPAAPQLPPTELTVKGANLQFVTLQTKEVIPVVSGTVVNGTSEVISGVTMEGLGFNERGEILLSSRAPLRSALAREKISDLSLENVNKFQHSLSARHSSIAPGEEVQFSIALLANREESGNTIADIDLSKLKYFSARVFSVR